MLGNKLVYSYHSPGTLAANQTFLFKLPFACQLTHVSAVTTNASNAILDIGIPATPEAYVANLDVGDSSVPAVRSAPADFVGGNYPHLAAGTVIQATLDYDGAAGVAAQNFSLVLIFTEG